MKLDLNFEKKVLIATSSISVFLILLGIFSENPGVIGNAFILSIFLVGFPFFFFRYEKRRRIREMEEKIQSFVRDLVESVRSGVPLHKAIEMCSRIDYGKLSDEVRKMSNQLSWGLPLTKVLDQFVERVKSSKKLTTAIKIIKESYISGGDMTSTLYALSYNMERIEDAEKEKRSLLNQYVVLIYAIAFIFLGISVAIIRLMVPIFQTATLEEGVIGMRNPCADMDNPVCQIMNLPAIYLFASNVENIGSYYVSIFFYMSMIVGIASGLVVGQIYEDSIIGGVKHSLIICSIVLGIFLLLKAAGLLGI